MVLLCVVHEDGKPRLTPTGAPETRFVIRPSRPMRDHRHVDRWRASRHRQPRCGGARRVRADRLWVGLLRPACPARAALSHALRLRASFPASVPLALGVARWQSRHSRESPIRRRCSGRRRCCGKTKDAQVRVSHAEALVRSARLFLFDSLERLWNIVIATGEAPLEERAHVRLAPPRTPSQARSGH